MQVKKKRIILVICSSALLVAIVCVLFFLPRCCKRGEDMSVPQLDTAVLYEDSSECSEYSEDAESVDTSTDENRVSAKKWRELDEFEDEILLDQKCCEMRYEKIYSEEDVEGEWARGTRHVRYMAGGTGLKWDTGDDVQAIEGQPFTWTIEDNRLEALYPMATMGGVVSVRRQVVYIDYSVMKLQDDYGGVFEYSRVEQTLQRNDN